MTALKQRLLAEIERSGPIPISEYMARCLYDADHGYYTKNADLGAEGDFITAPEISQAFGEVIGLAIAQAWMDQGCPDPFVLAEAGPGRGLLMSDILRATAKVGGFHKAMRIHLLEVSTKLRDTQKQTLSDFEQNWIEDLTALPDYPLFLIANEYFDCLPIRQYRKTEQGWQEQMIGSDGGDLRFILGRTTPLPNAPTDADFIETSPAAIAQTEAIANHIATYGGAALLIDYGMASVTYDSLQAIAGHKKVSVLDRPGEADLTAHVDFQQIKDASKACQIQGPETQGTFLERLGISARMGQLAQHSKNPQAIIRAHRRLVHPDEMGTLFKAMALTPKGAAPFSGFDA